MVTVASETWTGSDGSAWPGQWSTFLWGGASAATIQGNKGRLKAVGLGGAYDAGAEGDLIGTYGPALEISGTATYVSTTGTGENYVQIYTRYASTNGYIAEFGYGNLKLWRRDGGSNTLLVSTAKTFTTSTTYGFRFNLLGSALKFRVWDNSGAEPGSWDLSTTDATYNTAGVTLLILSNGADGATETWDFDNLVVDDISVTNTASFRSASSAGVAAAPSTGITVTKPSGVENSDVLYAFISKTTYADTATFTCSGWTEVTSGTRGTTTGNDRHVVILRKVITNAAGEAANYTFVTTSGTSSQMCGTIICVAGADTTTPEDIAVPAITFTSNDATPASLNATSAREGALALAYVQLSLATTATKTMVAPPTYTLDASATTTSTTGSLDNQQAVAYKSLGVGGSTTGTFAWLNTADDATTEVATAVVLVRAGVRARPAVAALTLAQPAVTASAGGGATASPAVAPLITAQPAVTPQAGQTSSPAVASLVTAQPAATAKAGATSSPAVAPLAIAQPAVTPQAGGSKSPAVAALVIAQPAVTPQAGATSSPAVAPLVLAQPAATAGVSVSATPAVAPLVLAQPAVTAQAGASSSPAVAPLVIAQPAVTPQAGATSSPAVAPLVIAQPAVTVTAAVTASPATAPLVLAQPAVTPQASATTSPSVASLVLAQPAASPQAGATSSPATAPLVLTQPAVSAQAGATSSPSTVVISFAQPAVTAQAGQTSTPGTAALVLTFPAPSLSAGATASPATVPLLLAVLVVDATGGSSVVVVGITTSHSERSHSVAHVEAPRFTYRMERKHVATFRERNHGESRRERKHTTTHREEIK